MNSLVSTQWLAVHLGEPDLVAVDSSWHMPTSGRSGREEFLAAHIPGARFLDIEEVRDRSNPLPHTLPRPDEFGAAMERIGVGSNDRIVIYDDSVVRTAARGWFMLRHFGAATVAILDGGFRKWRAEGRPVESGEPAPRPARFEVREAQAIVTRQELLAGTGLPWADARSKARFEGTEPDPRPGIAGGHAPGARNLPFASLYREDGTMRSEAELIQLFADAGIDPARPFVASCGSGVTANSLIFAAHLLGNDTESNRSGLGQHDPGDVAQFAADLIHERKARLAVRLAALMALAEQRLDACRGRVDQPFGPALEPALAAFPGAAPSGRHLGIEVVSRTGAEPAVDQPQRMTDACQPRHRFGDHRPRFRFMLRDQAQHPFGLGPSG
jgi:thiosulfate/3-mercaptopyruvate sulfurtransferase